MAIDSVFEFEALIGENELKAYQAYISLTRYENTYSNDEILVATNKDYSARDMSFPVDLLIKER